MKRTTAITTLTALCAIGTAYAQSAKPLPMLSGCEIQAAMIADIGTGQTIYAHNAGTYMQPASLTKLFSTAAALEKAGPKTKITTTAYIDTTGRRLTIVGAGDPTIGSKYYPKHSVEQFAVQIADSLMARGLTALDTIMADCSYMTGSPYSSKRLWEDMGNYYGAAPCALNYGDNAVVVTLKSPKKIGAECSIVSVSPTMGSMPQCHVVSYSKKADSAYVYGLEGGVWYVDGAIPSGKAKFPVRGIMSNPPLEFCRVVRNILINKGITVADNIDYGTIGEADVPLAQTQSPNIESIIKTTNFYSVNLYADALMMMLSRNTTSWNKGAAALRAYGRKHTKSSVKLYDGSGLSPSNCVTAEQVVALLSHMHKSKYAEEFRKSLPIAGRNGTLLQFGRGTPIDGKVSAKSGTMTGVVGYAGYVDAPDGGTTAFCIIINRHAETNNLVKKEIAKWLSTTLISSANN